MKITNPQDIPIGTSETSALRPNYENPGIDTTTLDTIYNGPTTRSRGKLKLDNQALNNENTVETFPRTKKKSYKEVKYKEDVSSRRI